MRRAGGYLGKYAGAQEGAAIVAFKLVSSGVFDEEGVIALLQAPGSRGDPACSGTRNLQDNLSDLRAQVSLSGVAIDHTGSRS